MRKVKRPPPNAKAAYVKDAVFVKGHKCHWPDCEIEVKPAYWGCPKHWFALPRHLQHRMWAAYVPGQEINKSPSTEYVAVSIEIQEWIKRNAKGK